MAYLFLIAIPFIAVLYWVNWRYSVKQRGYSWVGKFKVINKKSSFIFYYLFLTPGQRHKVKVDRELFEKMRVGDFIQIRRDALGQVEEISKVNNFSSRLNKVRAKHFARHIEGSSLENN